MNCSKLSQWLSRMRGSIFVLIAFCPYVLWAQAEVYDFNTGTKVRLWLIDQAPPVTGVIVGDSTERLSLVGEYGAEFDIENYRIRRAFVSMGYRDKRVDAALNGVLIGYLIGGVAGFFLRDSGEIGCCDSPLAVSVKWGALGAGLGGMLGAATTREREVWRKVPMIIMTFPLSPDPVEK